MLAIELKSIDKIHPLRSARARSMKRLLISLFQRRTEQPTVAALRGVSLAVEAGKALGVIGMNGAGKTSLLRLIAGIAEPTRGRVKVKGRVLPMLELGAGFHPDLSGYENIFLQGTLLGLKHEEMRRLLPSIVAFAELEEFLHMPVRHYSSGMFLRLGFAISVHVEPDVLLIDEAFSVGDIYFQEKCFQRIREMHRRGCTLMLVTHDVGVAERLCDEILWIDKGEIAAQGPPAEIAHRYKKALFDRLYPKPVPLAFGKQASYDEGRCGTGDVTLDYLDFLDAQGRNSSAFANGEPMKIRVRYRVHAPLSEADFLISIQSFRGPGVACLYSKEMRRTVRLRPEGGEIVLRIERVDFAPGPYQLSALVVKPGFTSLSDFYDFHMRLYKFDVMAREGLSEVAGLDPPCRWEHRPAA
jgi:ABC-type polysaccharide/polyol phosphate transport system ATPase subunit